jgi:hypothetical protein
MRDNMLVDGGDDAGLVFAGVILGLVVAGIAIAFVASASTKSSFSFEGALSSKGSMVCTESDLEDLRGPLGRGYKVVEFLPAPDQRCAVVRLALAPVEAP